MSGHDTEVCRPPEEAAPSRRPYEPPTVEVLELRPEEQLLACDRVSAHHCGHGGVRKHS